MIYQFSFMYRDRSNEKHIGRVAVTVKSRKEGVNILKQHCKEMGYKLLSYQQEFPKEKGA